MGKTFIVVGNTRDEHDVERGGSARSFHVNRVIKEGVGPILLLMFFWDSKRGFLRFVSVGVILIFTMR